MNKEKKSIDQSFRGILSGLLNIFIRIDSENCFVPSFKNVLVDPKTLDVHLNLFSFAGF